MLLQQFKFGFSLVVVLSFQKRVKFAKGKEKFASRTTCTVRKLLPQLVQRFSQGEKKSGHKFIILKSNPIAFQLRSVLHSTKKFAVFGSSS
jgi:hypothetical protein